MIEEIKELFQNFIAPQLEGIRGDIRALSASITAVDARVGAVDTKVESYRRELLAEIRRVEEVFSTDFVRLEEKVDVRLDAMKDKLAAMNEKLAAMNERIDIHRRELLAEIKAALP